MDHTAAIITSCNAWALGASHIHPPTSLKIFFLSIPLLLLCVAFAPVAHAAVSFVQQVSSNNLITATSTSLTFDSDTTAGDLLIAVLQLDNPAPPYPVMTTSDSLGNSWACPELQIFAYGQQATVCYAEDPSGGADTVTMSINGTTTYPLYLLAQEYSGLATSNPLDVSSSSPAQSGTTFTTPGLTTTNANDYLLGIFGTAGSTSFDNECDSPWTLLAQVNGHDPMVTYQSASSASTYAGATCATTYGEYSQGFTYAFKQAVAAPPVPMVARVFSRIATIVLNGAHVIIR